LKFFGGYDNRAFTEGFPDLENLGANWFSVKQRGGRNGNHRRKSNIASVINCFRKLVKFNAEEINICEIGCGPNPETLAELRRRGFNAIGVEPIRDYVEAARTALRDADAVVLGTAEQIPLQTESQSFVILEAVLEHVDSPRRTLAEIYRILVPGGVAYIYTTTRYHVSLRGSNGEFRVPFYNWFPATVKEGYVLNHLHYNPALANFTPRPAVHWFTYADLCKLGRDVGFAQFYSPLDLVERSDSFIRRGWIRRYLLGPVRRSPWLRALALLQFGGSIFMWKRV